MVITTGLPRFSSSERMAIRRRYWKTKISQRELALELGISRTTLRNIIHALNIQDKDQNKN